MEWHRGASHGFPRYSQVFSWRTNLPPPVLLVAPDAQFAPSISSVALRVCRDECAARATAHAESTAKAMRKILPRSDFPPPARCAFVETNAQRATYGNRGGGR